MIQLSIVLFKYEIAEIFFSSSVVRYCVFYIINEYNSWKFIIKFAFFFNTIIHCLQLWIVYVFTEVISFIIS